MDKSNKNINDDMEKSLDQFYQKREDDKLKARWKKILSEEHNIQKTTNKSAKIQWLPVGILAIAAAIAVVIFAMNPKAAIEDILTQSNLQMAEVQMITNQAFDHRGSEQEELTFSSNAYSLLKEKNYKEAISIYIVAENTQKLNEYDTYHLGFAYAKISEFEKSITTLEKLKSESKYYEQQTNWLLALNHLQLNQQEKANVYLKYIIDNKHYKSQEAKKLIT